MRDEGRRIVSEEVVPEFHDECMGIPVILRDGVIRRVYSDGSETFEVLKERELEVALLLSRVRNPIRLSGRDVRFFRKVLGVTARSLAERLNVSPETVSRWENDKQGLNGSGGFVDQGIRLLVCDSLKQASPEMMEGYDPSEIINLRIVQVVDTECLQTPVTMALARRHSESNNDDGSSEWAANQAA